MSPRFAGLRRPQAGSSVSYTNASPADRHWFGEALGATTTATYRTGALGDLLAIAGDEATVRALRPDFTALGPYWSHRLGRALPGRAGPR